MKSILNALLKDLEEAYEQSDIRQYCLEAGHEWFYSLVTTTMKQGGPLIVGFNWGASKGEKYKPQSIIEECDFAKEDVGSLSRILPYCRKYFGQDFLSTASQTNYCFFRSERESQISDNDIALCEPIFEKLVATLKPSFIICFSSKLRDYMIRGNKFSSKTSKSIAFYRGASTIVYEAIKGTLMSDIEICFLPHPNFPMKGAARAEAWEFCCGKG